MFYSCGDITEIDFSNLDSSQVNSIISMFYQTTSLITLNLANFSISSHTNMFEQCNNLKYISFKIMNESDIKKYNHIIYLVPNSNVIACANENDKQNIIIPNKGKKVKIIII